MLNLNTPIANQVVELVPFLQNLAVGIIGLLAIIWINVFFIRRIAIYYEINARIHLGKTQFNRVFVTYFIAITFLMLVQVICMLVWGGFIFLLGLIDHPFNALLFAGSCYTTIGIISDVMPSAWKLQAIFIALSGLFALALTTAAMLNMAPLLRQAWYHKHDKSIRKILAKTNLPATELDVLEGKLMSSDKPR